MSSEERDTTQVNYKQHKRDSEVDIDILQQLSKQSQDYSLTFHVNPEEESD